MKVAALGDVLSTMLKMLACIESLDVTRTKYGMKVSTKSGWWVDIIDFGVERTPIQWVDIFKKIQVIVIVVSRDSVRDILTMRGSEWFANTKIVVLSCDNKFVIGEIYKTIEKYINVHVVVCYTADEVVNALIETQILSPRQQLYTHTPIEYTRKNSGLLTSSPKMQMRCRE